MSHSAANGVVSAALGRRVVLDCAHPRGLPMALVQTHRVFAVCIQVLVTVYGRHGVGEGEYVQCPGRRPSRIRSRREEGK